jgi:hypothetical protein
VPLNTAGRTGGRVIMDYFQIGSEIVVVETDAPGHGPMCIGVGDDWHSAVQSLESTPIEGHDDPERGLEWAIGAGWFGQDAELQDFVEIEAPVCECQCGCDQEATTTSDDFDLCEACSHVLLDEYGDFVACASSGLGQKCHKCGEEIEWRRIKTGARPGLPNYRLGSCECGDAWKEEELGGWGNYEYSPPDEAEADEDEAEADEDEAEADEDEADENE